MIKEVLTNNQKIRKIEKVSGERDVYGIETKDTHMFLTTGNLLIHNCFPKDLMAIIKASEAVGYNPTLLKEVWDVNKKFRKMNESED